MGKVGDILERLYLFEDDHVCKTLLADLDRTRKEWMSSNLQDRVSEEEKSER